MYPKLALENLKKNRKFYIPYILTIIGAAAAFYILLAINGANDLPNMQRYLYLKNYVFFGVVVTGIFSVIFLFYTNSFLMKRRNKEIGLYNILGMDKRHISRVLMFETIYISLIGIGSGVVLGIIFQKLVTLFLYKLIRMETPFGFYISYAGIGLTFIFFMGILACTFLYNLRCIHIQNPIELLRGGQVGEKEPKTKWLLAILGAICLGGGYYMAVKTKTANEAIAMYFIAVILVIIGTYFLFTAVSIVVLKLLRKNKRFYYKTKNFIGISGMLYRMKRNAVGLANICILSTMVLVMVSGTMSLYLGTEDSINTRYKGDLNIEVRYNPLDESPFNRELMLENINSSILREGRKIKAEDNFESLSFGAGMLDGGFIVDRENNNVDNVAMMIFITAKDYANLTNTEVKSLAKDEVLLHESGKYIKDKISINFKNDLNLDGETLTFKVKEKLNDFPEVGDYSTYTMDMAYCVVADNAVLDEIYNQQSKAYGDYASEIVWNAYIDIDGTSEEKIECAMNISDTQKSNADNVEVGNFNWFSVASKDGNRADFYGINGGFFFLGMFLGLLFIMATVLIIYYKQISEGYEDRERFQIMQKVGLDKKDIKKSINKQVITVFFMPLIVASIHIAFNFKFIKLLLTLFSIYNVKLIFLCTVGTILGFMVIYSLVYMVTAKVYYKIVS